MKYAKLLAVLLVACTGSASAQQAAQAPAAGQPAQQARLVLAPLEPGVARDSALQVAQAVDAGQAGMLWDGAAQVAKAAIQREAFVGAIGKARGAFGRAVAREWLSLTRQFGDGQTLPAGQYVSVLQRVLFDDGKAATELVSFRYEEDGTWRLSGYLIN